MKRKIFLPQYLSQKNSNIFFLFSAFYSKKRNRSSTQPEKRKKENEKFSRNKTQCASEKKIKCISVHGFIVIKVIEKRQKSRPRLEGQ